MAGEEPLLSVENLRTTFETDRETVRAVDGVSFDVAPGRTLAIVGESGSGKSVTARSITGLVDAPGRVRESSRVRYHDPAFVERIAREYPDRTRRVDRSAADDPSSDGSRGDGSRADGNAFVVLQAAEGAGSDVVVERGFVDLAAAPDGVVRRVRGSEIAMVFQDAQSSLNPVYTVGNQIRELLRTHRGLRGREATETATELLADVGIPDPRRRLREYPHQFSGGMQQRAAIALALACDPSVLVCDEPTTALDVTIQAQILDLLADLQRESNLSIVFITHDMGVVAQVADHVAVVYAGEIVERATVEALFDSPAHPYTRGLLESIPGLNRRGDRLATIDGEVPTPTEPPTSCRFAPRCPEAFEDCRQVHPSLVAVDESATGDGGPDGVDGAAGDGCGGVDDRRDDPAGSSVEDRSDHVAACLLHPGSLSRLQRLERHDRVDGGDDE